MSYCDFDGDSPIPPDTDIGDFKGELIFIALFILGTVVAVLAFT